jgi:hypothetical protein
MSAVETPPEAAAPDAAERRRCPRCGSPLSDVQEWCLECGSGVGVTVARPPSWRGPVALVVVLLAIAAAALALALVELAGDAEQVSEQPAAPAPTPAPTTAPAPTAAPTPQSTTVPPTGETGGAPIQTWPTGQEGWTVVLESSATASAAQARATELSQQGVPVGILDSDDFGSLEPGRHVVFAGQYDSRRAADQALRNLSDRVDGAYVRRVAAE